MRWLGVFLLPLDRMLVHSRSLPHNLLGYPNNLPVPICTPGWREALWELRVLPKNTTQWPWPGLEPGPLDPGMSALTTRPLRLRNRFEFTTHRFEFTHFRNCVKQSCNHSHFSVRQENLARKPESAWEWSFQSTGVRLAPKVWELAGTCMLALVGFQPGLLMRIYFCRFG